MSSFKCNQLDSLKPTVLSRKSIQLFQNEFGTKQSMECYGLNPTKKRIIFFPFIGRNIQLISVDSDQKANQSMNDPTTEAKELCNYEVRI